MKVIVFFLVLIATAVLAIPQQLATSTAATTDSTEVTATTSMSSITPAPAVMEDINGNTFTCFTEGNKCSRDAFGGVGDHLPQNQSADWTAYAKEALFATTFLPISVVLVSEPCNAYANNAVKCPPSDPKINTGTGSSSVHTDLSLQPSFALPGSCRNFLEWQRAVQCQGIQKTTATLMPIVTRTLRAAAVTDVSHFHLNVRLEYRNGSRLGYLAEQQIEGKREGIYNLTVIKEKTEDFHYFHLASEGRLRGMSTNGVDHSSSRSELQWYHKRDTNHRHDDDNDETREVLGPLPIILIQESAGFAEGSLGEKYEEIWGQIEWDADRNMIPLEKLSFDSGKEDKHPYKQLVLRDNILYIATRRWVALFKAGLLPNDQMEGWELVIAGAEPYHGKPRKN